MKNFTVTFMDEMAERFDETIEAKSKKEAHKIALGLSEKHNYGIVSIKED